MNYINIEVLMIDDNYVSTNLMALAVFIEDRYYYFEFNDYDFGEVDNPEKINKLMLLTNGNTVEYRNDDSSIYYIKDTKENISSRLLDILNKKYSILNGEKLYVLGNYTAVEFESFRKLVLLSWKNNIKGQFKDKASNEPFNGLNFKMVNRDSLIFMLKSSGNEDYTKAVDKMNNKFNDICNNKSILLKLINNQKLFEIIFNNQKLFS